MALTYIRNRKGLNYYREKRTSQPTRVDQIGRTSPLIAQQELVPKIVEMQKQSLVDKIPISFFSQMGFGRPCSCLNFRYKIPDRGKCTICYGVGYVGGFNKIGTRLEILDPTRAGLTLTNVEIDTEVIPNQFKLSSSALSGDVVGTIDIPTNIGVDAVVLYKEDDVTSFVKRTMQPTYTALTQAALDSIGQSQLKLDFKVHLSRSDLADPSPTFTHLYLRWKISEPEIFVDMPHKTVSVSMREFGLPDLLQSTSVYLPATISRVTSSDFFIIKSSLDIDMYRDEGNRRYKITELTANRALGIITSWDLTARLIQAFETLSQVPE